MKKGNIAITLVCGILTAICAIISIIRAIIAGLATFSNIMSYIFVFGLGIVMVVYATWRANKDNLTEDDFPEDFSEDYIDKDKDEEDGDNGEIY